MSSTYLYIMESNGRLFEVIDIPDVGLVKVAYAGGVQIPTCIIKSHKAKQYSDWKFLSKDIDTAFQCVQKIKTLPEDEYALIEQSLSFYAVVTYGKCFTKAEKRRSLELRKALKYCDDNLKDLHSIIMDLRHKYVAHGEVGLYEINPVSMNWWIDADTDEVNYTLSDNLTYRTSIRTLCDDFATLLLKVNQYIEEGLNKAWIGLNDEVASLTPEYLIKNSIFLDLKQSKTIKASGMPVPEVTNVMQSKLNE